MGYNAGTTTVISNMPLYWENNLYSRTYVYWGCCYLSFCPGIDPGEKSCQMVALAAVSLLALLLSWGYHLPGFNAFFFRLCLYTINSVL